MNREAVTTSQAADAFGCSDATLKRWCDRGSLQAVRTPGGHRRITVASILAMVRHSSKTLVAPQKIGLPRLLGERDRVLEHAWSEYRDAILKGNEDLCQTVLLDLYLAGNNLAEICDLVIAPAFADLGDLWACGRAEVYQEHRACELCLRQLTQLQSLVTVHSPAAPLAIGCTPEGDPYSIPTIMVQMVLSECGWRAVSLGRSIPFSSFEIAVEHMRPELAWLSVSTLQDSEKFIANYNEFFEKAQQLNVPVLLGGRALDDPIRHQLGYSVFGDTMQHIRLFLQAMNPTQNAQRS